MRAVFVTTNNRTSAIHRGVEVAHIVGGSHVDCKHVGENRNILHEAHVVIHVKFPCSAAFSASNASHMYDRVDSVRRVDMRKFQSEIVSCRRAVANCRAKKCFVIPHHLNLRCNVHGGVANGKSIIGYVGKYVYVPPHMKSNLSSYRMLYERNFDHPCRFFNSIDIAVSWKKPSVFCPQERFSNPIYFNIPTIGTDHHCSFTDLDEERNFICSTEDCVRSKIEKIRNGSLRSEFSQLRKKIIHYVSKENVRKMYIDAFESTINMRASTLK